MNREEWLKKRSIIAEERMDNLFSSNYDENWGKIEQPHKKMIENLLKLLPKNPFILDAACGTGKYWQILIDNNCRILGIDHSIGMLNQANKKFPAIETKKMKLHSFEFTNEFDAIICVDAMENVFPEHWPIVLKNFAKGLKNNGYLYFTVELLAEKELQENFEESQADGVPVMYGEDIEKGGLGGYHYYPNLNLVNNWIHSAKLKLITEDEEGVYHHFIVQRDNFP